MAVARAEASAVLVTRGDVELDRIYETLAGFDEVIVWNNGARACVTSRADGSFFMDGGELDLESVRAGGYDYGLPDLKVAGRIAALHKARNDTVYVQDDDCLVEVDLLLDLADHGRRVCNMPASRWPDYPDSALVGWGAVFPKKDALDARLVWADAGNDLYADEYLRECDVVFTTLFPFAKVDVGFRHLPWAELPGRMFTGPRPERAGMLERARLLRDAR